MPPVTSPAPTLDDILRLFQETDRIIKESQKETDKKFQEMALSFKAVNTSIGNLGNRLGQFVEDAVRPSAVRLFRECGIDVHEVYQNVNAKRDNESLEIDLLVVNDNDAVVIECKSNLGIDDVNEHWYGWIRLNVCSRVIKIVGF